MKKRITIFSVLSALLLCFTVFRISENKTVSFSAERIKDFSQRVVMRIKIFDSNAYTIFFKPGSGEEVLPLQARVVKRFLDKENIRFFKKGPGLDINQRFIDCVYPILPHSQAKIIVDIDSTKIQANTTILFKGNGIIIYRKN